MKEHEKSQLHSLVQELVQSKHRQRQQEEALVEIINKAAYKRWLHERVLDQYKHERILQDMARQYLEDEIKISNEKESIRIKTPILQEINSKLEEVAENIQFISILTQPIEDFKMYKMLQGILSDEYTYQTRLIRILLDK